MKSIRNTLLRLDNDEYEKLIKITSLSEEDNGNTSPVNI